MADEQHENGETGSPEPGEVTEVTEASAPAEAEPAPPRRVTASRRTRRRGTVVAGRATVTAVAAPARRPSRVRRLLVGFLVFLSCLAVVVTGLTLWTHYTVMNTDGYMNLVGPIGKDPQAIQNLSEYVGGQVVAATDLQQRVTDALPAARAAARGADHELRRGLHHQGRQEGPQLARGLRPVAQDQSRRPREDRRPAARRDHQCVHRGQRREAEPAAADQPGAPVGGRTPAGRALRQAQPARHRARHRPRGRHPGGGQLVGQAAALRLRPDHAAPVGRARTGADGRQVVRPPHLDPAAGDRRAHRPDHLAVAPPGADGDRHRHRRRRSPSSSRA